MWLAASLEQELPDPLCPQNSQLASSGLILPPTSLTHKYKCGWEALLGPRGSGKGEGKTLKRRKSAFMKEKSRTKPGRQINLRDAKTRKRRIKGLSGEEVVGRENTKPLNQND